MSPRDLQPGPFPGQDHKGCGGESSPEQGAPSPEQRCRGADGKVRQCLHGAGVSWAGGACMYACMHACGAGTLGEALGGPGWWLAPPRSGWPRCPGASGRSRARGRGRAGPGHVSWGPPPGPRDPQRAGPVLDRAWGASLGHPSRRATAETRRRRGVRAPVRPKAAQCGEGRSVRARRRARSLGGLPAGPAPPPSRAC